MESTLVESLEAILPQTQCGLCTYDGCKPYAQALAKGERIDRCVPGGIQTLNRIADLLERNPSPYQEKVAKQFIPASRVYIEEDACIGCTKCIQACPVDAIIGAPKLMHSVIQAECTGCNLCLPVCPTNCMINDATKPATYKPEHAKKRYLAKMARQQSKSSEKPQGHTLSNQNADVRKQKQAYIEDALKRTQKRQSTP